MLSIVVSFHFFSSIEHNRKSEMGDNTAKGKTRACKLTRNLIISSTTLSKTRQESMDKFLGHVTHLHLQTKKLRVIENLDICVALKVLYLYDNKIEVIENLEFAKNLAYLYLENNVISELPSITNSKLKKLYLDENQIGLISGLEELTALEVLSVSRQRLPRNDFLKFDIGSLSSISRSLEVLDISGNNLSILQPFTKLFNLRKLFCADNKIENMAEIESVVCLPELVEVNFKRNPVCSLRKYRDIVIGAASDTLREFDDTAITLKNIEAIRGVQQLRKRIGLNDHSDSMISSSGNTQKYPSATSHNQFEEEEHVEESQEQPDGDDDFQFDEDGNSQVSADDIESQGDFQIAQY
jgi:hypothetical protein